MLKIRVLGRGLIPRINSVAPRMNPFPADLTLIQTIMTTPGLKVQYMNPETRRFYDITRDNIRKVWDKEGNLTGVVSDTTVQPEVVIPPAKPPEKILPKCGSCGNPTEDNDGNSIACGCGVVDVSICDICNINPCKCETCEKCQKIINHDCDCEFCDKCGSDLDECTCHVCTTCNEDPCVCKPDAPPEICEKCYLNPCECPADENTEEEVVENTEPEKVEVDKKSDEFTFTPKFKDDIVNNKPNGNKNNNHNKNKHGKNHKR